MDISRLSTAPPVTVAPVPASKSVIEESSTAAKAAAPKVAALTAKKSTTASSPAPVKKPVSPAPLNAAGASSASLPELNKNPRAAIAALLANDPGFEVLDLSGNTMFAMKHREFSAELGQALRSNGVVKEVHLKSCDLDKLDVQELCEGIMGHLSLNVLDLEKNKIDNEGAVVVANAMRNNTSIRELNLLGQQKAFGDPCLTAFVDMFEYNVTLTKIIWRLDSRKSFAINKLLVRNNTIQKNLQEKRDVSSLIPAKCNVPELLNGGRGGGGGASTAVAEEVRDSNVMPEEDDDYCATVDLNVAVKPRTITTEQAREKLNLKPAPAPAPKKEDALDSLEEDMYDEVSPPPAAAAAAPAPGPVSSGVRRPSAPAPVAKAKAKAAAPVPAAIAPVAVVSEPVRSNIVTAGDDDDDDVDTVELNTVVPAKAPSKPAPASPRATAPGPARGLLPPQVTAGGRLRAMSGRGKAPNTAALLATKLPPRKTMTAAVPLPTRTATKSSAASTAEAARAAVAEVAAESAAAAPKKLSVPPPANAPHDVLKVYEDLSALNDRFVALSGEDDMSVAGPELIAELARIRDEMLPLHTKHKIAGHVVGAVAKWRALNIAIPKRVNS